MVECIEVLLEVIPCNNLLRSRNILVSSSLFTVVTYLIWSSWPFASRFPSAFPPPIRWNRVKWPFWQVKNWLLVAVPSGITWTRAGWFTFVWVPVCLPYPRLLECQPHKEDENLYLSCSLTHTLSVSKVLGAQVTVVEWMSSEEVWVGLSFAY